MGDGSWAGRPDLSGRVAVVAGATRGASRAIALELGAAGATVYCTGRSVRGNASDLGRAETIEDTAELVTAAGGVGVAARTDHTQPEEVRVLFERVAREQDGRLDVLVIGLWGADHLTEWGVPFWEITLARSLAMLERAVLGHLITARHGVPLMVARGSGLVVEVTDGNDLEYRGNLYYDLAKTSAMRLALGMAEDLKGRGVTALAITPGFLRSEAMLEHFGVSEASWRDAINKDPFFEGSETPHLVARSIVALAGDPAASAKAGRTLASWDLAEEYGIDDADGRRPHWKRFYEALRAAQRAGRGEG